MIEIQPPRTRTRRIAALMALAVAVSIFSVAAGAAHAQDADLLPQLRAYEVRDAWRRPIAPQRIAERTWQIGTAGLSAILLRGSEGAILIDGGMPQAADHLLASLEALGLAPSDLKLILHSHAHADHVGPLAAIRRATGARVLSNAESAQLLARGGADDLHFGDGLLYPPVAVDRLLQDGERVRLGDLQLTVHFTPGHTPGSMSWTWNDRHDGRTLRIAYVDSLTAPGYRLLDHPRHPRIVDDYRASFATVRALPCDLLLTPHPDASGWRYEPAPAQQPPTDCRAYADKAEAKLGAQLAAERAPQDP